MQNKINLLNSFAGSARELEISPWTLHKHAALGNIKVTRIGRRVFLCADELARIAREGLPKLSTPKK